MNWIFNVNGLRQKLDNEEIQKISFTQKRKFSGEVGENIIILEEKNSNWVFTRYYEIMGLEQDKFEDGYTKITIALKFKNFFKEEKLVEDYSYSLLRVSDFKNPSKHYNKRVYNRIEDVEFDAIVNDKIYTNRTILGTIFNSLHSDHQKSFIQYLTENDPILLIKKPNVNKALEYLYQYLEQNIIEPIIYLKEIGEIFENNFGSEEFAELEFAEEKEHNDNSNKIKLQLEIIEEYQNFITTISNIPLDISLSNLNDNNKFMRLFKNSRLPLTLK